MSIMKNRESCSAVVLWIQAQRFLRSHSCMLVVLFFATIVTKKIGCGRAERVDVCANKVSQANECVVHFCSGPYTLADVSERVCVSVNACNFSCMSFFGIASRFKDCQVRQWFVVVIALCVRWCCVFLLLLPWLSVSVSSFFGYAVANLLCSFF